MRRHDDAIFPDNTALMSEAINHYLLDIDSLSWANYQEAADYPQPESYWGNILNTDPTGHTSVL